MTTPPEYVAGVDGSEESLKAAEWAADRAAQTGGELRIVCTYAVASYSAAALDGGLSVLDDKALRLGAERVVEEAVERVADKNITVKTQVEVGEATSVLTEISEEVDMIVLGSRGRGGFADRLLGSVSSAVPAHAHCPVVVVPPHESGEPFIPVKRIVVGVDGSEVASAALRAAVDEAIAWDAELTVVAAVPIAGGGMMSWMPAAVDRRSLIEDIEESLDKSIKTALDGRDCPVERHTLDGSPAALLTEFSTAVDLVVVGTRGRGGFAGMLLGSTSQTVLQHSTCPVMTVPSRKGEADPSPTTSWERR